MTTMMGLWKGLTPKKNLELDKFDGNDDGNDDQDMDDDKEKAKKMTTTRKLIETCDSIFWF